MSKQETAGTGVPAAESWQGPMSWAGSPLRVVEDYSRVVPIDATFTRGEVILTLSESIGPGMTRQTERALPALIRLERGAAAEVHLTGLDGQCWTYRPVREGRRTRWQLFVGASFPVIADAPASRATATVERVVVQSTLPLAGSLRHVSLMIDTEGRSRNLASGKDPDPND